MHNPIMRASVIIWIIKTEWEFSLYEQKKTLLDVASPASGMIEFIFVLPLMKSEVFGQNIRAKYWHSTYSRLIIQEYLYQSNTYPFHISDYRRMSLP